MQKHYYHCLIHILVVFEIMAVKCGVSTKLIATKLYMQFFKRILGVKRSTTNMMVYSELGRLPLYISRNIRIVKHWLKLLNTDNCILKECYATLYDECLKKPRAINWVSQI